MLSDDARRMIELQGRRRELREALKDMEAEIAVVEQRLLDEFSRAGMQKMTLNGYTLYLHRQAWARPRDGETLRAINALVQNGYGDYVILGTSKVSSLFRGDPEEVEGLPPEIRDAFEVYENVSIRARRAG